ncbi:MAG: hypothetical protein WC737_05545 [Parcubacteria group bacterium]|jgi:biotin operon repressor
MNNNPLTIKQNEILIMIKDRNKRKPVSGAELITFLDIYDKDKKLGANLRSVINTLRDKGHPICANGKGYYYPQNVDELSEYIDNFQHRIDQQQTACNILKERLKNWSDFMAAKQKLNENINQQPKLI